MSVDDLKSKPVRELNQFLVEYGITEQFTEKSEIIKAIKGDLNERYYQQRRVRMLKTPQQGRRKSEPSNPLLGMFNNVFGGKNDNPSTSGTQNGSRNDFFGAFAELKQVLRC